ncbi:MAG: hypothetical protein JXB26_16860 [Candidatus Aminicenantes bacterium]|nr:hypothetical protein [Candidatus Aminicenantes bacterium]
MEDKIEKMNRVRRNIFLFVLTGTGISFILFLFPRFFHLYVNRGFNWTQKNYIYPKLGLYFWLLVIIISIIWYWLYRYKLKKNSYLVVAVNDERIKLAWLKAYRFAFFVVVGLAIYWKWEESGFFPQAWRWKNPLPWAPWLITFGAVISLTASFLYHSREAKKKENT